MLVDLFLSNIFTKVHSEIYFTQWCDTHTHAYMYKQTYKQIHVYIIEKEISQWEAYFHFEQYMLIFSSIMLNATNSQNSLPPRGVHSNTVFSALTPINQIGIIIH